MADIISILGGGGYKYIAGEHLLVGKIAVFLGPNFDSPCICILGIGIAWHICFFVGEVQ
jgi:hypothetical protein